MVAEAEQPKRPQRPSLVERSAPEPEKNNNDDLIRQLQEEIKRLKEELRRMQEDRDREREDYQRKLDAMRSQSYVLIPLLLC